MPLAGDSRPTGCTRPAATAPASAQRELPRNRSTPSRRTSHLACKAPRRCHCRIAAIGTRTNSASIAGVYSRSIPGPDSTRPNRAHRSDSCRTSTSPLAIRARRASSNSSRSAASRLASAVSSLATIRSTSLASPINQLTAALANQPLGIAARHARQLADKHYPLAGECRFSLM